MDVDANTRRLHAGCFCRTWAAINGKPISSSIPYPTPTPTDQNMKHQLYFDIKHLQKGDLPPTIISANQSLGCTDGAGNEVRFAITTTLAPEENGWMLKQTYCRGLLQTIIVFI